MSLLLRTAAVGLAAAFSLIALVPLLAPAASEVEVTPTALAPTAVSTLSSLNTKAVSSLVERSPFARDRGAFARNAGPPAPEIEIRLAGVSRIGKGMSASLKIGGETVMVRKGDTTPAGVVAEIEASAVVFEDGRRIEMFKSPEPG